MNNTSKYSSAKRMKCSRTWQASAETGTEHGNMPWPEESFVTGVWAACCWRCVTHPDTSRLSVEFCSVTYWTLFYMVNAELGKYRLAPEGCVLPFLSDLTDFVWAWLMDPFEIQKKLSVADGNRVLCSLLFLDNKRCKAVRATVDRGK